MTSFQVSRLCTPPSGAADSAENTSEQGLTLAHFPGQLETTLGPGNSETTQRIPQKVLTLSREVDECKPCL